MAGGRVWVAAGPSPTAHRGGTLRMVTSQPLNTIDPGPAVRGRAALQLAHLTHDSLVSFQVSAGPAGLRLVPDLAVALPRPQRGGREYTFRLRRGIVYSDGRPLRATDFRRGIERLFRIRSSGAGYFDGIVGRTLPRAPARLPARRHRRGRPRRHGRRSGCARRTRTSCSS